MSIAMQRDHGNVYRVEIRGTLRKADLERCERRLAAEMTRVGPVRLLFVLIQFDGWERRTDWSGLTFYATHGRAIERIAIVGPPRWRNESLMFAGADLRKAQVRFFPAGTADDARAWLCA
jgi:hypothetical protein